MNKQKQPHMHRRGFLATVSTGAAALGVSMLATPLQLSAKEKALFRSDEDPEEWFKQIKGKHRIVFDVTEPIPVPVLPFAWPKVFLMTNEMTGTPAKDCSVIMVLRHDAIPYAMEDRLWEKYKFGEAFKIQDVTTNAPSVRNAFWKPKPGAYNIPGVGEVAISIDQLQENGVLFCVCDVAMTVNSAAIAQSMNMDPAEVKKDWVSGVLPGIQVVPSGVWAVNRAQEHGCSYCSGS